MHTVTSFYEQGDPQLVGMMSLLQSVSPADLTARDANNNFVLSSQDQALDGLKATAVLLQVQTEQLAEARDRVARKQAQARREAARGEAATSSRPRRRETASRRACRQHKKALGDGGRRPSPRRAQSWPARRPRPLGSTGS